MNSLPTVMKHEFSKVPSISIERSTFDRSHGIKTTFDAGYLVPIYVDEALPGDTFNLRLNAFARLATPIKPIMDNLYLDTFFFSVPIRLIWNNWEKFQGAQDNPTDTTDYEVPQFVMAPEIDIEVGDLSDYMGIPTDVEGPFSFNSLHHRGYSLIWNSWFRDQNLQNSVVVDKDDGPDTLSDYVLLRRGKRHDYFTSALPWPQKGVEITLPLGGTAPIDYVVTTNAGIIRNSSSGNPSPNLNPLISSATSALSESPGGTTLIYDPNGTLVADLAAATASTVNALREALQMQVLLERDARGGTRYIELVKSRWGVTSPDLRATRPEYLGGGSSPINIHPVPQTAVTTGTTPQGNLAAFGTSSFSGHGFNKAFTEHCVIIGLANVRADLTYQQGLNRMFSRRTRFDFYEPALAHLGEQAILNKEIYLTGLGDANDELVFGYQERYAEYRYKPSMITGQFRSTATAPLDMWHLSQEFGSLPTLDDVFIQDTPPIDRVIAVPSEPHILFDGYFKLTCARPMPVYAIPTLGDRI